MENTIVVTRVFNAPIDLVWKTWTDPELVKRWWGPDKFTCPSAKIDFRAGGVSVIAMKAPNEVAGGQVWFNIWVYEAITPFERIEFVQSLSDAAGNKLDPTLAGMPPDFPAEVPTVVTFKSISPNKTEMTVTQYADMGQMTHFAKLGLEQSIDKMTAIFSN